MGDIYKELGNKYGPIDITFINIGAYNFFPILPEKDKSIYHTNPEEALSLARDLKKKKSYWDALGNNYSFIRANNGTTKKIKKNAKKFGF